MGVMGDNIDLLSLAPGQSVTKQPYGAYQGWGGV